MKKVREHARTLQQTVIRGLGYHISCASLTAITWNWSLFWFPRFCMNWSFIFDFEVFLHFVDHASRHTFLLITNLMHFFLYLFIHFISLHVSSITVLIIRRSNSINTSSGMISLCEWLLGMPGILSSHSHRLIIPDDVLIQFDLLMMNTMILETCREV